jgi:hypothetical protein
MEGKIMPEDCSFPNYFELFDELVHTLMPAPDPTPDTEHLRVLIMNHTARDFDIDWVLSNIAIICFHSLIVIKHLLESIAEADNVRPITTRKWTHEPNNPASEDTNTNFIP